MNLCLLLLSLTTAPPDESIGFTPPPLGLNLSGVKDYASEYPFIDTFRSARTWVSQRDGGRWGSGPDLVLTVDGYPKQLEPGTYATAILLNAPGYPTGTYVLRYDGRGELDLRGDVEILNKTDGRWEVTVGATPNLLLHLRSTDPADPLRNIRFWMPGREAAGESGEVIFAKPFLDRCRRFGCLRFMDWMETNNSEIRTWDDRPWITDYSWSSHGVPVEVMCRLADEANTDAWFCVPHLADDDYVRRLAETIMQELRPTARCYVEHSNEVWNGQFAQAKHARVAGRAAGLSDNDYQAQLLHHAKRSGEIFAIFKDVLGEDRTIGVLGSQSVNPWVTEQVTSLAKTTARADAVAIAPYFGGRLGDPKMAADVRSLTPEQLAARCRESIAENAEAIRKTKAICDRHGLDLIAYEAGQHLVGRGGSENDAALTETFQAFNRDPLMRTLYLEAAESWVENGGGLWCVFSSVTQPSKWGSWGMLEYDGQPADEAPKYQAIDAMLSRQPRR